jgi:hypothetical protein
MTKEQEALKLALEALEKAKRQCHHHKIAPHLIYDEAIAAIKEALAQPEQEPTCPECKAAVLYECVACSSNNYPPAAQPEQEAVGSVVTYFGSLAHGWFGDPPPEGTLLYTAPPLPVQDKYQWLVDNSAKWSWNPSNAYKGKVSGFAHKGTGYLGYVLDEAVCLAMSDTISPLPVQPEERNFCPRCGKRTADSTTIHTCTPPQENT